MTYSNKIASIAILTLITHCVMAIQVSAQTELPSFLQGTWKMENADVYEHWDVLNAGSMKGFSYRINVNVISVTEYLDISIVNGDVIYTASVLNQNQGRGIHFKLSQAGDDYLFENPEHDFPKVILYRKLSDDTLLVRVSDGGDRGFSITFHKLQE